MKPPSKRWSVKRKPLLKKSRKNTPKYQKKSSLISMKESRHQTWKVKAWSYSIHEWLSQLIILSSSFPCHLLLTCVLPFLLSGHLEGVFQKFHAFKITDDLKRLLTWHFQIVLLEFNQHLGRIGNHYTRQGKSFLFFFKSLLNKFVFI